MTTCLVACVHILLNMLQGTPPHNMNAPSGEAQGQLLTPRPPYSAGDVQPTAALLG